jgi:hypothetical protein
VADINYNCYPHAGIAVPSETPFFPVVYTKEEDTIVEFNQGYLIDYQQKNEKALKTFKVSEMDAPITLDGGDKFFVRITTEENSAKIAAVALEKINEADMPDDFHFSANNLDNSEIYEDKSGNFLIPVCEFDNTKKIKSIFLRENIHWQKINFSNTESEAGAATSIGVLYNWGDSEVFDENPTVKFKRIVQKSAEESDENSNPEHVIQIEDSADGKNIVITTQFPKLTKDKPSVLVRDKTNVWEWIEFFGDTYPEILIHDPITEKFRAHSFQHNGLVYIGSDENGQKEITTLSGDTFKLIIHEGYFATSSGGGVNFVLSEETKMIYYIAGVAFLSEPEDFPENAEVRNVTYIVTGTA